VEVILDFLTVTSDLPLNIEQVPYFYKVSLFRGKLLPFISPYKIFANE